MAPNYVRVGVRIRPPFEDEIADELAEEPGGGGWRPAVSVVEAREGQAVAAPRAREKRAKFAYDYAFGPEASQADVFDAVAAPVVDAVAAGGARARRAPGLGFYAEGLREYVVRAGARRRSDVRAAPAAARRLWGRAGRGPAAPGARQRHRRALRRRRGRRRLRRAAHARGTAPAALAPPRRGRRRGTRPARQAAPRDGRSPPPSAGPPLAAETQSTLQFASRCARVALGPRGAAGGGGAARAPGAAVDYAAEARARARARAMEAEAGARERRQRAKFEATIARVRADAAAGPRAAAGAAGARRAAAGPRGRAARRRGGGGGPRGGPRRRRRRRDGRHVPPRVLEHLVATNAAAQRSARQRALHPDARRALPWSGARGPAASPPPPRRPAAPRREEEEGEADSAYSQLDAESAYSELDDDYSQLG
ncbi:microtubule motor protein [Aureococcus anophagefferens]|uniref:Microtubule motor protein n=1 Tax=Aureococcus anophagefferens TaxID=44056 RepID=A0ABR1G5P5_AURAN